MIEIYHQIILLLSNNHQRDQRYGMKESRWLINLYPSFHSSGRHSKRGNGFFLLLP